MKKSLIIFSKYFITFGAIGYLVFMNKIDFSKIGSIFYYWPSLLAVICIMAIVIFIDVFRLHILLKAQSVRIPYRKLVFLSYIGLFFNIAIPGGVSGDIIKSYYLSKAQEIKMARITTTVFFDRAIGLMGLLVISSTGIVINYGQIKRMPHLIVLSNFVIISIVVGIIAFWILLSEKLNNIGIWKRTVNRFKIIGNCYEAVHIYKHFKKTLIIALLISLFSNTCNVFLGYTVGKILGENVLSLAHYFFVIPLGLVSYMLPITPLGIGVSQAIFSILFDWARRDSSTIGANIAAVIQVSLVSLSLLGAIFYLRYKSKLPNYKG